MTSWPASGVLDLSTRQSLHIVGVGGAGMSAIAVILAQMGHRVSGSDVNATSAWPALINAGVAVEVVMPDALFAVAASHGAEVVAHSTAFAPTGTDEADADAGGRIIIDRATILAAVCARRRTVAVSGTHGKTSTTAMVATVLDGAGADPSFLVGAVPVGLGVAAAWRGESAFVVEADESDGTFLRLGAAVAVVTNVDADHLDYWGDLAAIEVAFDRFIAGAPVGVVGIDDPRGEHVTDARTLAMAERHGALTVGEGSEAQLRIGAVRVERLETSFDLTTDDEHLGRFTIATPGRHHARNAAVAVAVARHLGIGTDDARRALATYAGSARRFQVIGEAAGITVVDDYAHNPGKVRALLSSAAEAGWNRVVAIFQPHRYSRTRDAVAAFGAALALADVVAVTDVYGAGEQPIAGVGGRLLIDAVFDERPGAAVAWVPTLDDAATWARATLRPGDLCLTIGAGDISTLGPRLVADLRRQEGA